jgi:hypothetical protein
MDIDLNVINDLTKVETSGPFIECQYCHLQYQCATEVHNADPLDLATLTLYSHTKR